MVQGYKGAIQGDHSRVWKLHIMLRLSKMATDKLITPTVQTC